MKCECGKEIVNVLDIWSKSVKWCCYNCATKIKDLAKDDEKTAKNKKR